MKTKRKKESVEFEPDSKKSQVGKFRPQVLRSAALSLPNFLHIPPPILGSTHADFKLCAGFIRQQRGRGAIFYCIKQKSGIFFRLFCLTKPSPEDQLYYRVAFVFSQMFSR
jgi:hypothetical protein